MNWGYKIVLVYIVFITGIVTLVYKSSAQNQDLVVNDYYEQELKYQDKIDAMARTNKLSSAVDCVLEINELTIQFPQEMKGVEMQATVLLYCPSDEQRDILKKINSSDGVIHFTIPTGNKGFHKLKITWLVNKVSYYTEKKIMIP